MVDKKEESDKMYYCPWRKEIIVFDDNITKSPDVPLELYGDNKKILRACSFNRWGFC